MWFKAEPWGRWRHPEHAPQLLFYDIGESMPTPTLCPQAADGACLLRMHSQLAQPMPDPVVCFLGCSVGAQHARRAALCAASAGHCRRVGATGGGGSAGLDQHSSAGHPGMAGRRRGAFRGGSRAARAAGACAGAIATQLLMGCGCEYVTVMVALLFANSRRQRHLRLLPGQLSAPVRRPMLLWLQTHGDQAASSHSAHAAAPSQAGRKQRWQDEAPPTGFGGFGG